MSPELIGVLRASVPSPKCLESRRGQLAVFPRCPLDRMTQIWALRSRLEKQPTDLRRDSRDLGDGTLGLVSGSDLSRRWGKVLNLKISYKNHNYCRGLSGSGAAMAENLHIR